MIRCIKQNFEKNCPYLTLKYDYYKNNFNLLTKYLKFVIDYSIIYKDIKTFALFLYLHDISSKFLRKEDFKNYKTWRLIITYTYAYQIDGFTIKDLIHYNKNINDEVDKKILNILLKNMYTEINLHNDFLKNMEGLNISLKTLVKVIGKIIILHRKILHKRYKPGGEGYYECMKNFYKLE